MKIVYFQWWHSPKTGRDFTTIHLTKEDMRKFRDEVEIKVGDGTWTSVPYDDKIIRRHVEKETFQIIALWLEGNTGKRCSIANLRNNKWIKRRSRTEEFRPY